MNYYLEGAFNFIVLKYTDHVTSSVWMKSVLIMRANQGHLKKIKTYRPPRILPSDNSLSVSIEGK